MTTSSSSIRNDNRSDTFAMNKTGQSSLARLRPEKLDDAGIQTQISLIQKACGPIDADLVALIFHECDYHLQNTIARIQAGGVEDGGWQTAKSNNKKKINHQQQQQQETTVNGNSQSFRSNNNNYRRQERSYPTRRGHPFNANARYPSRQQTKSTPSPLTMQENSNESVPSQPISNEQNTPSSSSNDEFEFLAGATQSLTFSNSSKKISLPLPSTSSSTKRPTPSSIPQQPVAMHPTVQFSSTPLDIQFGDVLWNDSIPTTVTDDAMSSTSTEQDRANNNDEYASMNGLERETIDRSSSISSLPMSNTTLTNNITLPSSLDGTSHLSDHLNDSTSIPITSLSTSVTSFPAADSTPAPATSTPHNVDSYPSPSTQPSNLQSHPSLNGNLSAFTPYSANPTVYSSMPRDFPQAKSSWNTSVTPATSAPTTAHFKTIPTSNITPIATYPPQTSYPIANQQQYVLGTYPYGEPTVYQLITPIQTWAPTGGFPSTLDSYPAYTNYFPAFPGAQQYHSHTIPTTKYQYSSYDKDMYVNHGQSRSSSNDLSTSSSQQSTKEASSSSKLSATAATFSQAAPLTATSPTGAFYFNPVSYPMPSYIPTYQDRPVVYPSNDSRDNRTGAPYTGQTSRNSYQQQQQPQGRYNHHQYSTWHSQQ